MYIKQKIVLEISMIAITAQMMVKPGCEERFEEAMLSSKDLELIRLDKKLFSKSNFCAGWRDNDSSADENNKRNQGLIIFHKMLWFLK